MKYDSRIALALEVSGVLEQGGPALFAWMESVLPPGHATQPVPGRSLAGADRS